MAYGRFRRTGKSARSYGRKRTTRYRRSGRGYAKMPRFATVGFSRNVEKKYFDKTYQANSNETMSGINTASVTSGVTYISNTWGDYSFGAQAAPNAVSNDMLKGVGTGTTARTRIGNKIKMSYVKGAFTFTAAAVNAKLSKEQGGEQVAQLATSDGLVYLRTTFRFVIVKDLQVNSTDVNIGWHQVFDTSNQQAGVHSELNVDNMGRFVVLQDKIFTVDADSPQKTCRFVVNGSNFGNIRYNGPTADALTDKGLYVVYAAFVMGTPVNNLAAISLPSPVGHSRLCFSDD